MLRMTARESSMARATSRGSLFMSTTSAPSLATSAPAPIARPTSARARAGESLMPSPTMATRWPASCSSRTTRSLSAGSTSAMTCPTPTRRAMACAVSSLSPVSMTVRTPSASSAATASLPVGLSSSATAIVPMSAPFLAKKSGVLPSRVKASSCARSTSMARSAMRAALPAAMRLAPSRAVTPRPGIAWNASTVRDTMPRCSACAMIASASGCSLLRSSAAASLRSPFSLMAASPSARRAGRMSVTTGLPWVMVPVLSSTTVSTSRRASSASALLNRTPISAPRPVPTMMATGVARPSAHGQLMTTTATAAVRASFTSPPVATSHTANVTAAMTSTAGTKTVATLSAMRAMGALVALASSTRRMMRARLVSAPTRVARKVNEPVRLTVAALTVSPGAFSTGMDSPVRALSSMEEAPSSTTPSTGTVSPGRTRMTWPGWMSSALRALSVPSALTIVAVLGARSMRASIAPPVLDLLRVSRYLPTVTRERMVPALSR